jgi:hypothetical protein
MKVDNMVSQDSIEQQIDEYKLSGRHGMLAYYGSSLWYRVIIV